MTRDLAGALAILIFMTLLTVSAIRETDGQRDSAIPDFQLTEASR